jgi:hypothetical protein
MVFFILFLGLSVFSILISIYFLFKAYYGYTYQYIPLSTDLKKYEDELYTYYLDSGKDKQEAKKLTEEDVKLFLVKAFVNTTANNMRQNERKLKFLRITGWSLSAVLLTALLAFIPYSYGLNNDNTEKVKITNLESLINKSLNHSNLKTKQDTSENSKGGTE